MYIQYSGSNAPRAPGPFTRLIAAIVAGASLVLAFFLGFVFLISALIALAVFGAVLSYRARKYRRRGEPRPGEPRPGEPRPGEPRTGGQVLEGEWTEVRHDRAAAPEAPEPGDGSHSSDRGSQ